MRPPPGRRIRGWHKDLQGKGVPRDTTILCLLVNHGPPPIPACSRCAVVASQVLAARGGLVQLENLRGAPLCGQTLIGSVVDRVAIGCVVLTTRGSAFDTQ